MSCPWNTSTQWRAPSFLGHGQPRRWLRKTVREHTYLHQFPHWGSAAEMGTQVLWVIAIASFRLEIGCRCCGKLPSLLGVLPECLACTRHGESAGSHILQMLFHQHDFSPPSLKVFLCAYIKAFFLRLIVYLVLYFISCNKFNICFMAISIDLFNLWCHPEKWHL